MGGRAQALRAGSGGMLSFGVLLVPPGACMWHLVELNKDEQ